MKKTYVRPVMEAEIFAANESVAACWTINCNVPSGTGYRERNNEEGYQRGKDDFIASGYGCGKTHEASGIDAAGPSANAKWETIQGEVYDVFYFQARNWGGSNHHFCTLDSVNWNRNPNASN